MIAIGIFGSFGSNNVEAEKGAFGHNDLETVKRLSLEFLRQQATERGITGDDSSFNVTKVFVDELNMGHTRVRQTVNEIPVWGGEAIVHIKQDGSLSTITDNLLDRVSVNTQPNFSKKDALNIALKMYGGSANLTEKPTIDTWIFRAKDRDHLTYRVQMHREDGSKDTAMPVIFVDAQTGENVFQYDNLQTATGTGSSLYSGTVSIETYFNGSTYYMENTTRRFGTFDSRNSTSSVYRFSDTDNNWNSSTQRAAVDAHYGAQKTLDYYQNVHGRNGIDGSGGPAYYTSADGSTGLISSKVHYSSNYNNAFWNGSYMTYGDGDGSNFTPLVTLDICGHEMTHGVTERTANLTYSGESGALNESMSDVFGAMVERYANGGTINSDIWKIGEDAYTPSNGTSDALRYMDNPHLAGNSGYTSNDDPDHYSERYTGSADNGGVHINSGIANHAFYLATQGGTHHLSGVTVSGMGADAAERIWYRALTVYMTSSTNFSGARTATLNAASSLYGSSSSQYATTANAWCAVGVGICVSSTPAPTPTATTTPTATPTATPTPGGGELLINGGFEGSSSPWILSGNGTFYTANGNYSHSGNGYVYFGTASSRTGYAYQQVSIPSNAPANLTFWLDVDSAETVNRADDILYVELYDSAGYYIGEIARYDNRNGDGTGTYSQKGAFSLAAYRGQTVLVAFRVATDRGRNTTFRVDDVSLR